MKKRKTLQELTIKDNFLFGAVMVNEENCKEFLEMVLEIEIDQVKVSKEKSIVYHPEYKGVRLDVYARDEEHTHYNIEMQAEKKPVLGKRSRYYQSQMDMELLMSGEDYTELPNTYVIFLCDFDPFGAGKYRYTFQSVCQETEEASLEDGRKILFLNTRGKNDAEVPGKLVTFLRFVRAELKESQQDFGDPYVQKLQEFISYVKQSREMEERFMVLEEMLRDERSRGRVEGKAEFVLKVLSAYGKVPESLNERITKETNSGMLDQWFQIALECGSVEEFEQKIKE